MDIYNSAYEMIENAKQLSDLKLSLKLPYHVIYYNLIINPTLYRNLIMEIDEGLFFINVNKLFPDEALLPLEKKTNTKIKNGPYRPYPVIDIYGIYHSLYGNDKYIPNHGTSSELSKLYLTSEKEIKKIDMIKKYNYLNNRKDDNIKMRNIYKFIKKLVIEIYETNQFSNIIPDRFNRYIHFSPFKPYIDLSFLNDIFKNNPIIASTILYNILNYLFKSEEINTPILKNYQFKNRKKLFLNQELIINDIVGSDPHFEHSQYDRFFKKIKELSLSRPILEFF